MSTQAPLSTRSIKSIAGLESFKPTDSRITYSSVKTYIREAFSRSRWKLRCNLGVSMEVSILINKVLMATRVTRSGRVQAKSFLRESQSPRNKRTKIWSMPKIVASLSTIASCPRWWETTSPQLRKSLTSLKTSKQPSNKNSRTTRIAAHLPSITQVTKLSLHDSVQAVHLMKYDINHPTIQMLSDKVLCLAVLSNRAVSRLFRAAIRWI